MNAIEALKKIRQIHPSLRTDYAGCYEKIQNIVDEALAALEAEKPAECGYDALAIAKIIAINDKELEDDAALIQSFSASYHSSECAKCKALSEKQIAEGISVVMGRGRRDCTNCKWTQTGYAADCAEPSPRSCMEEDVHQCWQPLPDAPKES